MKQWIVFVLFAAISTAAVSAQNKGASVPVSPKTAQPKTARIEAPKSVKTSPAKAKVEPQRNVNSKPARDMSKVREAARVGIKRHQEIQSKLGSSKKGRVSERVRMTDIKTRKQMRPDIYSSKSGRVFEIKANTVSGRKKGKSQLLNYENAILKRGGLIFYEPKTGKYRIERTPYKEWKNRQRGEIRPTEQRQREKAREVRRRGF